MDDPRPKRSLADDPNFLASLSDLDRGLDEGDSTPHEPPPTLAPYRAAAPRPRESSFPPAPPVIPPRPRAPQSSQGRRAPLPPSIVSPFDALTMEEAPTPAPPVLAPPPVPRVSTRPALEPGHRRPLMDLFPAVSNDEGTLPPPAAPPDLNLKTAAAPPPPEQADAPPATASPYETFYGFSEAPFALTSDPRFFYHSTPHDRVCQQLLTAIRRREGLVVVTGETGTGKTTLCRTVMEQLDRRTLTSLVSDPFVSGEVLLQTILADFGVLSRDELARGSQATRHELSTTLISFVESLASLQASAIVIVDEAQDLPPDVFEQVRILAEAAETSSLLQLVLVGQPSLDTLLRRRESKGLHKRVTVRCRLEPLPADEIDGYVMHRLAVAGTGPRVEFDEPAMARLHRLSRGVPRVVNLLCDRALARGCEASASVVDEALIDAAAEDLDLGEPRSLVASVATRAAAVAALALCMLSGAGLAAWLFRDALARTFAVLRP